MAGNDNSIELIIKAVDQASPALKTLSDTLKTLSDQLKASQTPADESNRAIIGMGEAAQKTTGLFAGLAGGIKGGMDSIAAQFAIGTLAAEGVQKAFTAVKDTIVDSFKAGAESEKTWTLVDAALKTLGEGSDATKQKVRSMSEELRTASGIDDESFARTIVSLHRVGTSWDDSKRVIQASLDAASAGIGTYEGNVDAFARAIGTGMARGLRQFHIEVDAGKFSAESLNHALEQMTRMYGGQLQAEMSTTAGTVKMLASEWEEAKEAMGRFAINVLHAQDAIKGFIAVMRGAGEMVKSFFESDDAYWKNVETAVANSTDAAKAHVKMMKEVTNIDLSPYMKSLQVLESSTVTLFQQIPMMLASHVSGFYGDATKLLKSHLDTESDEFKKHLDRMDKLKDDYNSATLQGIALVNAQEAAAIRDLGKVLVKGTEEYEFEVLATKKKFQALREDALKKETDKAVNLAKKQAHDELQAVEEEDKKWHKRVDDRNKFLADMDKVTWEQSLIGLDQFHKEVFKANKVADDALTELHKQTWLTQDQMMQGEQNIEIGRVQNLTAIEQTELQRQAEKWTQHHQGLISVFQSTFSSIGSALMDWGTSVDDRFRSIGRAILTTIADAVMTAIANMITASIAQAAALATEGAAVKELTREYIALAAAKAAATFGIGAPAAIAGAGSVMAALGSMLTWSFDDPKNDLEAFRHGQDYGSLFMRGIQSKLSSPMFGQSINESLPIARMGIAGAAGGTTININFHAPVTNREFVRREIIPAIEDAIKTRATKITGTFRNLSGRRDGVSN